MRTLDRLENFSASSTETLTPTSETCPLLKDPESAEQVSKPSPVPFRQLSTLCALRLADPICFTQIFPYVNEMMETFQICEPSKTGFYSGIVESVFALAQLVSIYQWANLSDKWGRRPIIFVGIFGIAISTIWLGFSRTLVGILLARAAAGVFSGNVAVMHSVLGEITDSSNQALAFPIYGLCWPLGVILGPLIGGTFSNPAQKYPSWFGSYFFEAYPYFLPCFVVTCITLASIIWGYFYLDETLPSKVRESRLKTEYSISYGIAEHIDRLEHEPDSKPCAGALLRLPVIRALCFSGCALSFVGSAFDVVFVLFCYSPIQMGGLSFSASQIGYALAVAGVASALIQIVFMPVLLKNFPSAQLYKLCMAIWPFAFLSLPPLNWIAQMDDTSNTPDEHVRRLLWVGIGLALALSRVACLAFSLNMILVKEHAPGPSSLGSANGLAQFAQCLARAIAPAFVSSLFTFSVDHGILSGNFWTVAMVLISALAWMHSSNILDGSDISLDTVEDNDSSSILYSSI